MRERSDVVAADSREEPDLNTELTTGQIIKGFGVVGVESWLAGREI